VKKKAQTIMKTADKDGNGELSIEEFRVVAQKFPNVLFPTFNKPSQE
jgi:Ca2+-binding EF-hand superfamily protein